MEGNPGTFRAPLAGTEVTVSEFLKNTKTLLRIVLIFYNFIMFSAQVSIAHDSRDHCVFFEQSKCNFHMLVSTLGLFTSVFFLVVDWQFVKISSAQKRKLLTQCELVINAAVGFFTFVAFCSSISGFHSFPADEIPEVEFVLESSAKAILSFTFFSIPAWAWITFISFRNYQKGVLSAFADPNDAQEATPYESIPNAHQLNLNWDEQSFRPVPFSDEFNKSTPNQPKNTY
ncbi:Oidioi.mRNA.OKI2018_I69.PAR.g10439.t2.cds [Oikopleura dioica]|uniref:Oidioi.mRNA.OKI2018_I69.PAR.g10439.t2.cds n=1 Tax=Oikopleura dioica TaxID=34765 RepID=A0ABN7RYA7_OIKDI|nr:Oidioi.mRNA.OKI2018_I69.PAR.g10439.t2.cds [Oikopleura dioica]